MAGRVAGKTAVIGRDPNLGPIFMNTLPVQSVEARDISNAVLFLASDEAGRAGPRAAQARPDLP